MTPKILEAVTWAVVAHHGQYRKGETARPYVVHPLDVARRLVDVGLNDESTVIVALLHDLIEDTIYDQEDIARTFGEEVAEDVQRLTVPKEYAAMPLSKVKWQVETMMSPATSNRARCVKVADKLSNLHSITVDPPGWSAEKKRKYAASALRVAEAACDHFLGGGVTPERIAIYALTRELQALEEPIGHSV